MGPRPRLPGVRAAAVIGAPHPRLGEIVVAALELADGANLATVRTSARSVLGSAAMPRRWFVVESLPRTTVGKIARGRVASGLADGSLPAHGLA